MLGTSTTPRSECTRSPLRVRGIATIPRCPRTTGYQLIVVEPSKRLIVFKDATFNDASHIIALVKHQDHYDGLINIPALMNRSYYCHHCDRGYNTNDCPHHNCEGQNCQACCRTNNTCPNFATWVRPSVYCKDCNGLFYGQNCFEHHKTKGKKKGDRSICESWKRCLFVALGMRWILRKSTNVTM